MYHLVIYRCANRSWKRIAILIRKPLKVGTAPLSLMNSSATLSSSFVVTPGFITLAISANVFPTSKLLLRSSSISSSVLRNIILQKRLICSYITTAAFNTSGFQQTVIVSHQQMTFNLLESIKNHTYKN